MYGIVIPNRYEDIIQPLLASIQFKIPVRPPAIIVMDGHSNSYNYTGIRYTDQHFCYSRAVNLGIQAWPKSDVILLNDDCRVLEWDFFNRLAYMASAIPRLGILSPLIVGCVGNEKQRWHGREQYWTPDRDFIEIEDPYPVCFPCVYLRRAMLDQIGLLDETIAGYGKDDGNLCQRARALGWKTFVTQRLTIQHGDGSPDIALGKGRSWATSFMRRWPKKGEPTHDEIQDYLKRNDCRTRQP